MRRQKGITMSGFLVLAVVLIFASLLMFKMLPPYMEFLSIQSNLKAIANDPEGRQGVRRVVEDLFDRRSAIDNISAVRANEMLISKEGDTVVLSFNYQKCVPIVFNVSACMDFYPTSSK